MLPRAPGSSALRSVVGTMKSLAVPSPPNALRNTFANTDADAARTGVLRAARQSGVHSSRTTRGGNGASIFATVSRGGRA